MFKFLERIVHQRELQNIPYDKKIRILKSSIENILKNNTGLHIPTFQRVNVVLEYILNRRLVGYYFENRKLIPALCAELNCM